MGIFVLCAVMAFRIAAKDHKIAEVDVCVVTADGATYQLCVCVFVWPGITQTCRCTRLTVSCKVNLRNCTFVCAFKFSRNICCVSVIPALIYTFLGGVTASLYIDKSLFFFFLLSI